MPSVKSSDINKGHLDLSDTAPEHQTILSKAATRCKAAGGRLTVKREDILKVLLNSQVPLSAYEILDAYKAHTQTSMPPMSVYRILEFLAQQQLIHKLSSQNKYVACAHLHHTSHHQVSQFLICQQCQQVEEIHIEDSLIDALNQQANSKGYQILSPQLELDCLCANCAEKQED